MTDSQSPVYKDQTCLLSWLAFLFEQENRTSVNGEEGKTASLFLVKAEVSEWTSSGLLEGIYLLKTVQECLARRLFIML